MEISVPLNNVNTQNIYFSEKKKNVVVDGDFIKIIYSTSGFEMNGLYILLGIESMKDQLCSNWMQLPIKGFTESIVKSDAKIMYENRNSQLTSKRIITFDPYSETNLKLINKLCEIEHDIIERYILNKCKSKYPSYILKTNLLCGTIKYHSEYKEIKPKTIYPIYKTGIWGDRHITERLILKISGIWETSTNVGITMKFILLQNGY